MSGLLLVLALLPTHPVHVSVAELDYRADAGGAGRFELAIRVRTEDLERALAKRQETSRTERITAMMRSTVVVLTATGSAVTQHLVGTEADGAATWIYVEYRLDGPRRGHRLRHTLFFELEPSQRHRVNLNGEGRTRTLRFDKAHPEHPL